MDVSAMSTEVRTGICGKITIRTVKQPLSGHRLPCSGGLGFLFIPERMHKLQVILERRPIQCEQNVIMNKCFRAPCQQLPEFLANMAQEIERMLQGVKLQNSGMIVSTVVCMVSHNLPEHFDDRGAIVMKPCDGESRGEKAI